MATQDHVLDAEKTSGRVVSADWQLVAAAEWDPATKRVVVRYHRVNKAQREEVNDWDDGSIAVKGTDERYVHTMSATNPKPRKQWMLRAMTNKTQHRSLSCASVSSITKSIANTTLATIEEDPD